MSIYKALHGVVAVVSLVVAPIAAQAECFTQKEWEAVHVRMLQTTLQVAALECSNVPGRNFDAQYNEFISRFTPQIRESGTALRAHFQRVYGKSGETNLDRFVTRLANNASTLSMDSNTFCADSASTFKAALAIQSAQLTQVAVQTMTSDAQLGAVCTTGAERPVAKIVKAHAKPKPKHKPKTVASE